LADTQASFYFEPIDEAIVITRQHAEELALGYVDEVGRDVPGGVSLMSESTIEKPYGWVFFFNSARFFETGDQLEALGGNSPILVASASGQVTLLGTAKPVADSLRQFEIENGLLPKG
jgi:hypothetical protein